MALPRLSIRFRIYGGMGILVLLGLSLTGLGIRDLRSIDHQVARMSALSDNNTRVLQIARLIETMHEASLRLKYSSAQSGLEPGDAADAPKMIEMLQAANSTTPSAAQRQSYESMLIGCVNCHRLRGDLGELSRQVGDNRGKLFSRGDQMTVDAGRLAAAARQSGSADVAVAAREVQAAILLAQVSNWRFLATHDPKGAETFRTNASAAMAKLARLERLDLPEGVGPLVAPLRASLAAYLGGFATVSGAMLKSDELFEQRMLPLISQQKAAAIDVAASLGRDFVGVKDATSGMITSTVALQKLIAGIALLAGGLIAWLVGRSIVRPVSGMTAAAEKKIEPEGGIAVGGSSALPIGTCGRLEADRIRLPVALVARVSEGGTLHLDFELDEAAASKLTQMLEHMGRHQAA